MRFVNQPRMAQGCEYRVPCLLSDDKAFKGCSHCLLGGTRGFGKTSHKELSRE